MKISPRRWRKSIQEPKTPPERSSPVVEEPKTDKKLRWRQNEKRYFRFASVLLLLIALLSMLSQLGDPLLPAALSSSTGTIEEMLRGTPRVLQSSSRTRDVGAIQSYMQYMDLSVVPPRGSPPNRPAIPATVEETQRIENIRTLHGYGGDGDKQHLGGFTTIDPHGISPAVWTEIMEYFGVKTLLDVGCGRGISTSWFYLQGVRVQCVEGSHDAIERSMLIPLVEKYSKNATNSMTTKENVVVEHDFTLGPWWPEETVDAVWSVELLEHISRNFAVNYLAAFKKAAIIFVTHSTWGGWHHTEVHSADYWIGKFELYGFRYSESLTNRVRDKARTESDSKRTFPTGGTYDAQHLSSRMLVFINPDVASRPEHSHLLSEPGTCNSRLHFDQTLDICKSKRANIKAISPRNISVGCYDETKEDGMRNVKCGQETNERSRRVNSELPSTFDFIAFNEGKHKEWEEFLMEKVEEDEKRQEQKNKSRL